MEERYPAPEHFATARDQLHELAASVAGAHDFGNPDYLPGLDMVLLSMDYDPHFTERGRRIAWGEVVSVLASRALAVKSMRAHPGFERHDIASPVVITGIPRTGTTALHKLMAVDARFQGLQGWLIGAPMPRPPRDTWAAHPLFQQAVERIERRFAAIPGKRAAHDMAADEVDECCLVMRAGFCSNLWSCFWSAPSYDAWWQCQSELPSYRYLRRVLQLIGSNEPDKRWLLKNPGHIANLDLLFAVFPDARVIQTHRDPAKAVPSLCSLLIKSHPVLELGRQELRAQLMGRRETAKWAKAVRDAEPVRQAHRAQVFDVVHGEFHREPLAVLRRIYDWLGMSLPAAVAADMQARIEAAPELAHGEHRYRVEDFGLTADAIRASFGDYLQRFGLHERR